MGAMAELRPIIVIGSFMAVVALLIGIMPSGFFGSNIVAPTPTNTSFYSLLGTNDTLVYNLTGSPHDFGNKDFGGWHTDLQEHSFGSDGPGFLMTVADAWYGFFYNREDFLWYDSTVTYQKDTRKYLGYPTFEDHNVLMLSTVSADYNAGNISSLSYYLKSSKTTMKAIFYFDQTLYTDPATAYAAGKLVMVIGIDFNERNTQINAWTVIGAFLTFQLIPNCEQTIALLVEIPFWFAEIYVAVIMVLRITSAIFGGGGS
jgi:hypothetical protein